MMKVYTNDVSGSKYLTSRKRYEVINDLSDDGEFLEIIADDGSVIGVLITGCYHINGNKWTVIND